MKFPMCRLPGASVTRVKLILQYYSAFKLKGSTLKLVLPNLVHFRTLLTLVLIFGSLVVDSHTPCMAIESKIKVLLIEDATSDVSKKLSLEKMMKSSSRMEPRKVSWDQLTQEDLAWAGCLLLGGIKNKEPHSKLNSVIQAVGNGTGLVCSQEALRSWPSSKEFSQLIHRKNIVTVEKDNTIPLAIATLNQRQDLTQSVPHFIHEGYKSKVVPVLRTLSILKSAPLNAEVKDHSSLPARMWLGIFNNGRICVSDLSTHTGPSKDLVQTLLLRGIEWSASGNAFRSRSLITTKVKGKFVLAADKLGSKDTGLVKGLKPMKGFYRGREVSQTMSFHGASWLTRSEREIEEEPEKVLDAIKIKPGESLCDLGAGNGYFTLRMAKRVGAEGKVFAVDIQKEMLDLLKKRQEEAGIKNIVPILSTFKDSKLPPNSVDLVLFVDVYHELSHPQEVMSSVHKAMKKNGRVVLVEYRGEDPLVMIKPRHRMLERQAIAELQAQGFKWIKTHNFLKSQHIIEFRVEKKTESKEKKK